MFLSKILLRSCMIIHYIFEEKLFCCFYLQAFSTEEILKHHIKDCFKISGKQRIMMPKKGEYVKFENYERKIKSPFIIYAGFEIIWVPEDNGQQKSKRSYTNKYKKHIASSYGYILVCVDDNFSKPFKTYLGNDTVYNFKNNDNIEESKYCSDVMKKHYNKELVMTKKDNENFKNSTKCGICDNDYVDNDAKVRDHCHITGKYRGSAHWDCNINLKLNHRIPVVYQT